MDIRKKIAGTLGAGTALLPLLAFAQDEPDLGFLAETLNQIHDLVAAAAPILIGVAVLVFFGGVIKYVTAGDDTDKRAQARGVMIYGVIALFVIVSVWGLVAILQTLTGTEGLGLSDVGGGTDFVPAP